MARKNQIGEYHKEIIDTPNGQKVKMAGFQVAVIDLLETMAALLEDIKIEIRKGRIR